MVEGPESRWALHNYPLESLFLSHRNMLLIYIDKIQTINKFIRTWTKIFVENVQMKVSTDIEKLSDDEKGIIFSHMNMAFGGDEIKSTSTPLINDMVRDNVFKLTDARILSSSITGFAGEMGLIYLVAKYQGYIAKNLQVVFTRRDSMFERIRNTDRYRNSYQKLSETSTSGNRDELEDDVLEHIIDNLRGIEEINKWLKDYLDIDLRQDTKRWKDIVEMFERRNVLIHKDGKVTMKYRKKTGDQSNEYLSVDNEYLSRALLTIGSSANDIFSQLMKNFVDEAKT
jgi:hypothetical protein